MSFIELFLIAIGLSMDAFAVSVCKGLAMSSVSLKNASVVGLWFGGFQAAMPLIGYFLGTTFEKYITSVDHWIAFALLAIIGIGMIKEAFSEEDASPSLRFGTMLTMAVATSIDALIIGITFGFLPNVNIASAVILIGATTFVLSAAGVKIGGIFGAKYKKRADV